MYYSIPTGRLISISIKILMCEEQSNFGNVAFKGRLSMAQNSWNYFSFLHESFDWFTGRTLFLVILAVIFRRNKCHRLIIGNPLAANIHKCLQHACFHQMIHSMVLRIYNCTTYSHQEMSKTLPYSDFIITLIWIVHRFIYLFANFVHLFRQYMHCWRAQSTKCRRCLLIQFIIHIVHL